MINIFVDFLLALNKILFNNLGLTIIVIGIASRAVFHPFLKSSLQYSQKMRDLKPKLDEIKRKHGHDRNRHLQEQSKIYKEAGLNPAAGCISPLIQLVIAFLLFQSLEKILKMGVNTDFFYLNLAHPDTWALSNIPFKLPGFLALVTAAVSLIQAKMSLPEPVPTFKDDSKKEKEKKQDFAEALQSSQGQLVYLFPVFLLLWANVLSSGIFLYWFVSTLVGIVQQYYITGWGGLKPWIKLIRKT